MSTIDLIILGFLLERSMNAYDLASLISDKQIYRFLKISIPAIYKRCKRLYADGFLDGVRVKEGEQHEKTVYSVNGNGKERFFELMEHFSSNFTPFFLDCNVFIWNIEKVDRKRGLKMLLALQNELIGLNRWIVEHERDEIGNISFSGRAIVSQYRMVLSTLCDWIKDVIADYKKNF